MRPATRFVASARSGTPRRRSARRTSSTRRSWVTANCTEPVRFTVPSVSSRPASSARRCASDARRYAAGMCLFPRTPTLRSSAVIEPWSAWQARQRRVPADGPPQSGQLGAATAARPRTPPAAGTTAGLDLGGRGDERSAADHAVARRYGRLLGQPHRPAQRSGGHQAQAATLQPHHHLGVSGVDPRGVGGPVAQPGTERVRVHRQVGLGEPERPRVADRVVEPGVTRRAPQGGGDLLGGAQRDRGARSCRGGTGGRR